ncbi:hypothetical protein BDZ94DRAFT_1247380 [Collybia nuda]|uniref:Uncharacterized protein n=1 Tax=Collybia nuda TaxID=64659 RepID=A0A9P5YGG1_9AGAR|nr:hypothetical protein BDZ94DRAFT_1247380 [Collybia nuda]
MSRAPECVTHELVPGLYQAFVRGYQPLLLLFWLQPNLILHMSVVVSPALSLNLHHRKRTSSFSFPGQSTTSPLAPSPRPAKAPRLSPNNMGLRRTESYLTLTDFSPARPTSPPPSRDQSVILPHYRSLRFYKEQRERSKANSNRSLEPITIRIRQEQRPSRPTVRHAPQSSKPTKVSIISFKAPAPTPPVGPPTINTPPRKSSPLAPTRTTLPGRPVFPRSKAEPNLHRKAVTTCMKATPEGQKILRMGPRLAVSIMSATKDLEQIVAAQGDREKELQDVTMADASPILTKSWVVVPGEDWEMVDCTN